MSKKNSPTRRPENRRLNSRLDSLFSELEQVASSSPGEANQPGEQAVPSSVQTTLSGPKSAGVPIRQVPSPSIELDVRTAGFRADERQVAPARSFLTRAGETSLERKGVIARTYQDGEPAALALAAPFAGDQAGLLLEFLDLDPEREWSEDEILLVEQVSGQLSLALENANLFTQTQARAEELGRLREISLELAQEQGDLNRVLDLLALRAMELLNSNSAAIWLYQAETASLELAAGYENGAPIQDARSLRGNQEPALQAFLEGRSLLTANTLAVSLSWQNQITGVLQVGRSLRFREADRAYTGNDQRLAELLSGQGSAVIQNSRLFAETQAAYRALELRERYQKNIAEAAAALTERGSQALPEVLQLLAEASGAAQARFLQSCSMNGSVGWLVEAEWLSFSSPAWVGKLLPGSLPEADLFDWLRDLPARTCLQTNARNGSPAGSSLLDLFACGAVLHIGVIQTGKHQACLSLCSPDPDRSWGADEISALQTAASILASALAREDLFHQVQTNLAETETLYEASARLNSAASYEEVLAVLRDHTLLGQAISVTIGLFSHPWEPEQPSPDYLPLAHFHSAPDGGAAPTRCSLSGWLGAREFATGSVYIPSIKTDPRFPHPLPDSLQALMPANRVVLAPLTVAGQWIGQIFAAFQPDTIEPGLFAEPPIRRLTSLAGQASVAVQNLNQLREIQARARQEAMTREIGVLISSSIDLDTVLKTTARSLGQALGASQVVVRLNSQENQTEK